MPRPARPRRHSRSLLRVGTSLTREHALQLAPMSSGNRAAHAVARTYPGGVEAFVAQMNRKAAEMGMGHSHSAEPIGCMAMLTRIRGEPLVLVLLDAGSLGTRSQDARKLRQWAGQQAGSRRATSARASSPR